VGKKQQYITYNILGKHFPIVERKEREAKGDRSILFNNAVSS